MMAATRRIVHVVRRFEPLLGGTERAVLDLASAQVRAGHRVTVVTADRDVSGVEVRGFRLPTHGRSGDVRVLRVPVVGNRRSTITTRPDLLIRAALDADVVHLHDLRFMSATLAVVCALARRPLIVHTHGLFFHTAFAARIKRLMLRAYYGPVLAVSGAWMAAVSETDERQLVSIVPRLAPRTVLLENGLDLSTFLAVDRRPSTGLVISAGRVASPKGLDDLINAIARSQNPGLRLVIAGQEDPEEVQRLRQLVQAAELDGRVEFRGSYDQQELTDLFATASVAAFPSRAEGFGLALLEAMAAGVPVLARDIPAHRSLLGPGLVSQLTDFSSPDFAAAHLDRLMSLDDEERNVLSTSERQRASRFDVARLVVNLDEMYAHVCSPRPRRHRHAG